MPARRSPNRSLFPVLLLSALGLGLAVAPLRAAPVRDVPIQAMPERAAPVPVAAMLRKEAPEATSPLRPVWHRGYAHGRGYHPPPRRYRGPPPGHYRRGYAGRGYDAPPRRAYRPPPPRYGYDRPYYR